MDFEKIRTDYEKRYGKKCEKIFFAGMPVTFFEKGFERISGCLSLGEAMAFSKREDGRITLQFSGSNICESFNLSRAEKFRDNEVAKILEKVKKQGTCVNGADVFFFRNSRLTDLKETLILGCLSGFCGNVPKADVLLPCFDGFEKNIIALSGKAGKFTVSDSRRTYYLPFFGGKAKIVIVDFGGDTRIKKDTESSYIKEAETAIKKCDFEKFGALLFRESRENLRRNKAKKELEQLEFVQKNTDALGAGILENGKIFALVENEKIDTFIHNLSAEYREFRGGTPEFYITDLADSGVLK